MSENKHTPEPWYVEIGEQPESIAVLCTSGLAHFEIVSDSQLGDIHADARRIVACVNACAGLETEMLEALVMDGTTLQNIMRRGLICLEQRDDLLKALEDIAWTRGLNERPSKLVEQLERKALIAIAKIKEAA